MQCQNLLAAYGVEHPVREVDSDLRHALGFGASDDPPAVNQPEAFLDCFFVGLQVGLDTCARKAFERILKLFVAAAVRVAIGGNEQVIGLQMQGLVERLTGGLLPVVTGTYSG